MTDRRTIISFDLLQHSK